MFMRDTDVAIRRTEAAIHALAVRMQNAVGDLDYETYLHEKRRRPPRSAEPAGAGGKGRCAIQFQSKFSIIG